MDPIMVQSAGELDAAFTAMQNERPDAVIVQPSLTSKRAAQLALSNRIPAVSLLRDFADEGGLMSYFSAEADMYRRAAALVDKVLKGARPAELPVEQPTHFEIVINLNTAKSLGLVIPPLFLARADEVIE
jgi:putative ABC transport system substrate-binding protein